MFNLYKTQEYIDWHDELKNPIAKTQISKRLSRITAGNFGDYKIFDGLIEFRFHNRGGIRIYALQDGNDIILLLLGGDKSSQDDDIDKAKLLMADYWSAKK